MHSWLLTIVLIVAVSGPLRAGEKATAALAGKWPITAATEAGRKWDANFVPQPRIVVNGSQFAATFGPVILFEGTLDSAKTPKSIDLKCTGGRHAGKTLQGIYEHKGDLLKICLAAPEGIRPAEFVSTDKTMTYLFECDRGKADWWPAWNYNDKKDRPPAGVSSRVFETADEIQKVAEYYEKALGKFGTLKFRISDGRGNNIGIDSGPGRISQDGTAEVFVLPEQAKLWAPAFKVKFDMDARVRQVGRDASHVIEDAKDGMRRSITARIYTQETKDYTMTVVITRAKDEKRTHIVLTCIAR